MARLVKHSISFEALAKAFDFKGIEKNEFLPEVDTGGYGSTTGERIFAYGQYWLWANLDGYWAWFTQALAERHIG